jgi:SNF2 family DNA or RNA helicase
LEKRKENQIFIVALLSYVKPIGYVVLPYSCFRENEKFITVHERISTLNIGHYHELSEAETEIFKLAESYSNQAIIKQFSKKKETPKDFFIQLDKKLLDESIRPFIERTLSKILDILLQNNIPFYNGKGGSNLYAEDKIVIEKESPLTSLKFTRSNEGTQYKLRVFHNNQEIKLNNASNVILVNDPCWYLAGTKLVKFNEQISGKLLLPFKNKDFVNIPKHIENQYFSTFIRKIANRCDIEAEGFKINDLQYQPSAILSLEADWQGRKALILQFQYGDKVLLANNPQRTFTTLLADESGFIFNRFKRNLAWEAAQVSFLKAKNLKQVEATFIINGDKTLINHDYRMIEWLAENHTDLLNHSFVIKQPENKKFLFEIPVLDVKLDTGLDWFDVMGTVVVRGIEIPFIRFKNHIINNIKEYELPSGEIVILPDEWFARFQDIMMYSNEKNNTLRVSKHHYKLLASIPNAEVEQLINSISFPEHIQLPGLTNVTLRPYQLAGYYWMHSLQRHGLGGILADDMGLGKTLQTIALLASCYPKSETGNETDLPAPARLSGSTSIQLDLFAQPEIKADIPATEPKPKPISGHATSLVVLPSSLIHNWYNELKRFAPWLRVYIHVGSNRVTNLRTFKQNDIILTTYGTLRNDIEIFGQYIFRYIILDESQTIKNPDSKSTQAVFSLQGINRMVLTGTPLQNSLSDIWSQFNFLNPGMLGSHPHFMKYYAAPIAKNPDDTVAEKLKNLISPFILRRTKEEVAPELPPITETAVYCSMTDEQQSMYEAEKSKIRNSILEKFESEGTKNTAVMVLRALMLLRQLANHPRMIDSSSEAGSGKFSEVTESLETILAENHKVLVFSSFVRHLKLLEEFCINAGYKYAMLTGATTNREKVIDSFKQKNDIQLFLISLKAGGVGLNLTEADYVFILDPWWNPAAEMQALNRAHRIGQDKNVFVYRFITKDTVEEKIVQLQQKKKDLADLFVTSDSTIAGMTQDEIMAIFF